MQTQFRLLCWNGYRHAQNKSIDQTAYSGSYIIRVEYTRKVYYYRVKYGLRFSLIKMIEKGDFILRADDQKHYLLKNQENAI